jgi:ATP-binding cassette, subfamily B, bacterial PglK
MALAGYRMLPSIQFLYGQLNQINAMRYTVSEIEAELTQINLARPSGTLSQQMGEGQHDRRPDLKIGAPLVFEKAIYLENITFRYPGSRQPVLENLSMEIPKNHSIGVIGTTGSGKSTLVDIILGLHRPQSGGLRVDGRVLAPEDFPAWHGLIGYVPQDIYLLDASVAANIAFGVPPTEINRHRLRVAAEAAQILEFIEKDLAFKWDTVVGERGVRLSGGQRQRIGLARALYHQPQILILDEATSALDTVTEAGVMQAISALHGHLTMIIIAHRLTTIEHCNSVIRLENGWISTHSLAKADA